MSNLPPNTPPAEVAAWNDYRSSLWQAFQNSYEDRWDQAKWETAVGSFQARHDRPVLDNLRSKNLMPALPALETQLKRGPPPFLRPGWVSPLQGKQVDLDWLDQTGAFVHIRGTKDGWRDASVLIVEFWASYVISTAFRNWPLMLSTSKRSTLMSIYIPPCHNVFPHLTEIAANHPNIKVVTFANEGIFNGADTDVAAFKAFVFARNDMNYPIYVDNNRIAFNALFKPGKNASIPLVFIITVRNRTIRWIGNAEEMERPLADTLAKI
ncbi:hypothetical protein BDY19DRAFT_886134 [Irpex rosettiformis]|uniref:Uncharacterized protein n=1 Tax=Irpex rosettiformis TaxID=378272 RepID=A0ACB8UBL3_9APHY|nr:hypothetical protein BDY19DRAFT_886134 [Irpex rosettiformis]